MNPSTEAGPSEREAERELLQRAFESRRLQAPWRHFQPVEPEHAEAHWGELLATPSSPGTPRLLYVHVPYCENHCLFCGFYRNRYDAEALSLFTERLVAELIEGAANARAQSGPIHAVYLGGGTPSALSAIDLHRVIKTIRERFPLASDCEVTVEGRIIHFDEDKVASSVEAGANRFSIGIQTFDTAARRRQGRRASREDAIAFVEKLVDRGDATVVVDLMFGLPLQTPEIWTQDLLTCGAIAPDGVDLYALNVFPWTPLHSAIERGVVPPASTLHELGPLYGQGVAHFERLGWSQVSNCHFARTTRERNRYNLLIKGGAETLAFGSGAGGSMGGCSYSRLSNIEAWSRAIDDGTPTHTGLMRATPGESVRSVVSGSLDRGRVALFELIEAGASAIDVEQKVLPEIHAWCKRGLAIDHGDHFELTTAGRFWSTNLSGQLVERLQ